MMMLSVELDRLNSSNNTSAESPITEEELGDDYTNGKEDGKKHGFPRNQSFSFSHNVVKASLKVNSF